MDTGSSDRSKNSTTILAAVLAALLAGGVVFVWQNAKVKEQEAAASEAAAVAAGVQGRLLELQPQIEKLQAQLQDALEGGSGKPKPPK